MLLDSVTSQRRAFLVLSLVLVAVAASGFLASALWTTHSPFLSAVDKVVDSVVIEPILQVPEKPEPPKVEPWDVSNVLRGPPTDHFRDNLLPDVKYITTWISAGWTNDVMTYINLIYLGLLTQRIPIVGAFLPSHIGQSPTVAFGDVFDVPRLQAALKQPIIEWHQVKNASTDVVDPLGCWNTWEPVQTEEKNPRNSPQPNMLHIDPSYTKAPSWIKLIPQFRHDRHTTFASLASLAFDDVKQDVLVEPLESPTLHLKLPPDDQVFCLDYLYYVCSNQPFEFDYDHSPAWRFVGQYMRWSPKLQSLIDEYIRTTLHIEPEQPIPPFVSLHIRHGDFANWCGDVAVDDCFAPISVIARRVEEVKQELLERKGIAVKHVILTSDERNATWWEGVAAQGWSTVDHAQTVERLGKWYPVLIDAGIQASGTGFVGTDRSTMSTLARRRVLSWQDGVARTIQWGRPGADDHRRRRHQHPH